MIFNVPLPVTAPKSVSVPFKLIVPLFITMLYVVVPVEVTVPVASFVNLSNDVVSVVFIVFEFVTVPRVSFAFRFRVPLFVTVVNSVEPVVVILALLLML